MGFTSGQTNGLTAYQLTVNAAGSTSSNPAQIGFGNVGSGNAYRFNLDTTDGLQSAYSDRTQLSSYWGLELRGNTQSAFPTFVAGSGTDAGVSVINTTSGAKALVVQGESSQSANLQEWQSNSGMLSIVNASGYLGAGATSASYPLYVRSNAPSGSDMAIEKIDGQITDGANFQPALYVNPTVAPSTSSTQE